MNKFTKLGVDIETTGLDPHNDEILIISACNEYGESFVWDYKNEDLPNWFMKALSDKTVMKIFHNASFDTKFIQHNLHKRVYNIWDTMVIEELLYLGLRQPKGFYKLGAVLRRRFGVILDKSEIKNLLCGIVTSDGLDMAREDVLHLIELQIEQEREVERSGRSNAARIENGVSYVFGQMEYNGLPINLIKNSIMIKKLRVLKNKAAKLVWDMLGYNYIQNIITGEYEGGLDLSSQKIARKGLEIKGGIKLKNYNAATLVYYLDKCRDEKKRMIIMAVLEYKKWESALGWRYDEKVNEKTGCIHPSFRSLGTETGRASSNNPNGQQVASKYYTFDYDNELSKIIMNYSGIDPREVFEARKGEKWLAADYDQGELRLFAGMADVSLMKEIYNNPDKDLHIQTAAFIKRKSYEWLEKHPEYRKLGKYGNFGCVAYEGGPGAIINSALKFGEIINWNDASIMRENLLAGYPEGLVWGEYIFNKAREQGYLINDLGYKRSFPNKHLIKKTVARNTVVQGNCGGITKEAMIMYQDWIEENNLQKNVRMILNVHDEIDCIAEDKYADKALKALKHCMKLAGNKYMFSMGVPCETGVGYVAQCWQK